jgi:hypothetical protein
MPELECYCGDPNSSVKCPKHPHGVPDVFWGLIAFNYPDQKHLWSDHVNADRQDS